MIFKATDCLPHFKVMQAWWKTRGYPSPEKHFLPPTGLMMWKEELPLCAGFLFKTDAKIAIINHVISNPDMPGTLKWVRSQALDDLLALLLARAKTDGFKLVTASSNVARLNERYERLGFSKSDENESHYGRVL